VHRRHRVDGDDGQLPGLLTYRHRPGAGPGAMLHPSILPTVVAMNRKPYGWLRQNKEAIMAAYNAGETSGDIARRYGTDRSNILVVVRENGGTIRPMGNPTQKPLTDAEREIILAEYAAGRSTPKIAKGLGRGATTVSRVLTDAGVERRTDADYAKYTLDHAAFAAVTDESAYWAGFLMADGCVYRPEDGQACIYATAHEDDKGHLESLRAFLKATAPIRTWQQTETSYSGGRSRVSRLSMRSDRLADDLAKLGVVPRKSLTARATVLAENMHFWRGVIDGDGYLTWQTHRRKDWSRRYPCFGLSGGSRHLLEQYSAFARLYVPEAKASVLRLGTAYHVRLSGTHAARMAAIMYTHGAVALPRKAAVAREYALHLAIKDGKD
jgi:hypothetical protein